MLENLGIFFNEHSFLLFLKHNDNKLNPIISILCYIKIILINKPMIHKKIIEIEKKIEGMDFVHSVFLFRN